MMFFCMFSMIEGMQNLPDPNILLQKSRLDKDPEIMHLPIQHDYQIDLYKS